MPESAVERWQQTALRDKHGKQLDRAELLLRQQRLEEAKKIIEPVLAVSPEHERARALLGLALFFSNPNRAVELVAFIDESSQYADMADTIRTINMLTAKLGDPSVIPYSSVKEDYLAAIKNLSEGHFDVALEQFIRVIRNDRYYDDDGSREAYIAVLEYLGEDNDITMKHRRDFGNALYV